MAKKIVTLALAAALCVGGCGYSLQGNLPDHIKSVAVPVFRNRTTEPGVESTISSAVVNAFTTNGKLRVVSLDTADSMLEGEIIGFEVQSLAFDSRLNLRSYRLAVTMNVRFRDLKKSAMLWEQQGLREVVDFQVAGQGRRGGALFTLTRKSTASAPSGPASTGLRSSSAIS